MRKFVPVNRPLIFANEKKFVNQALKTNWISSEGPFVKKFENKLKKFNKKKYGIAVSNGTAALEIALKALRLKKNSEVLVPSFSIISTVNSVIKNGYKPILVDSDINTWNMKENDVLKKITSKTKAILITHIYGLPVNMKKILQIAKKKKIIIIEDAAEVIGLKYNKKICGSFGDLSTFSFYANKHITTGEGGMICTNNKKFNDRCRSLRNLAFSKSYFDRFNHNDIGWNYRMSNIQAALGLGQLRNINWIVKRKRKIGSIYHNLLKNNDKIILQTKQTSYSNNIYWVFGILLRKNTKISRDNVMKKLLKLNIDTRPFFLSMNKQKIFKKLKIFKNIKMPNSENLSSNGFYLPSGLGIKDSEIKYVAKNLLKILS
mgnify:FL=1